MAASKRSNKTTRDDGALTPKEHLAIFHDHLARMKEEGFEVMYLPLPNLPYGGIGVAISLGGVELDVADGVPTIDGVKIE